MLLEILQREAVHTSGVKMNKNTHVLRDVLIILFRKNFLSGSQ